MANIVFENFPTIYALIGAVHSRPNNHHFGTNSAEQGNRKFFGTDSYTEAEELLASGIAEKAEELRKSLNRFRAQTNVDANRRRTRRDYCGYRPNVPAAIAGLPKTMYRHNKVEHKVKAVNIIYDCGMNCGTSAETLEKSGSAILSMVYALEMSGYRVQLNILPFAAETGSNRAVCMVGLKDWRQPLDILKLSFPLASASMFRRFGFHWAETSPDVTVNYPSYGHHMEKSDVLETFDKVRYTTKNAYVINVPDCEAVSFDPLKLAERIGIAI